MCACPRHTLACARACARAPRNASITRSAALTRRDTVVRAQFFSPLQQLTLQSTCKNRCVLPTQRSCRCGLCFFPCFHRELCLHRSPQEHLTASTKSILRSSLEQLVFPLSTLDDSDTTLHYVTHSILSFQAVADTIVVRMPPAKTFARYSDLPVELRRQIVQEAAKPLIDACYIGSGVKIKHELCSSRTSLAQYACLDSVWKEVIELPTFQRLCLTLDDIRPFGVICGKRRGILHYIDLDLREGTWPPQFQAIDLETMISLGFHALFGIMKNWDPAERKRKSLIKIGLHLSDANDGAVVRHDFSRLPKVRVIGELEQPRLDLLQPSTIISLYERLPNANRLVLNLLLAPTVPGSIQEATSKSPTCHQPPSALSMRTSVTHGLPIYSNV